MELKKLKSLALVVEDNPSDSLIDKYVLEDAGMDCVCVTNGFNALDEVDKYCFSLIIVDLQMPHMNGLELIRRLRRYETTKNTPIIVTSSRNEQKDILGSINAGANDYLIKPLDPMLFKTKIDMQIKKNKADWYEYEFDNSQKINTVRVELNLKIMTINEMGCIIESPLIFQPDEQLIIHSDLFLNFTDESVICKVVAVDHKGENYQISLNFLGLSEEKRQKLRVFCRKLYVNSTKNSSFFAKKVPSQNQGKAL